MGGRVVCSRRAALAGLGSTLLSSVLLTACSPGELLGKAYVRYDEVTQRDVEVALAISESDDVIVAMRSGEWPAFEPYARVRAVEEAQDWLADRRGIETRPVSAVVSGVDDLLGMTDGLMHADVTLAVARGDHEGEEVACSLDPGAGWRDSLYWNERHAAWEDAVSSVVLSCFPDAKKGSFLVEADLSDDPMALPQDVATPFSGSTGVPAPPGEVHVWFPASFVDKGSKGEGVLSDALASCVDLMDERGLAVALTFSRLASDQPAGRPLDRSFVVSAVAAGAGDAAISWRESAQAAAMRVSVSGAQAGE